MKIAVLGTGNVGVAISADLSIKGFDVSLIKTSQRDSESFNRIIKNEGRVFLKEKGIYTQTKIKDVSSDLSKIKDADVIFVTIQSTYYEELIKHISQYLNSEQIVVCFCSYMSSFYFAKYCLELPMLVETTGPYLEGRVEQQDEVVFRVGCRLDICPLSVFHNNTIAKCLPTICRLYDGFRADYSVIESALLNPNMVLHTVGAIMSMPRVEYSDGNFCMYREAYSRKNKSTIRLMLKLDEEKKNILKALNQRPIDIFVAGGFRGVDPLDSFYQYSESKDRSISPTSIHSRYITEDVSQGLVLLEDIAKKVGIDVPITSSLINVANCALDTDFRKTGRTLARLRAESYIEYLRNAK